MDPTELHGCGAARYQRFEGGVEKWAGVLPFTLQQGVVTEDGKLAGYSYSHGLEGNLCPDGAPGEGTLNVVIVGPEGGVRLNDSRPRAVLTMHGSVEPRCVDIVLQEMLDRFVLMVAGRRHWEMYQLSTGRQVAPFRENFDFNRDGALRGAVAVRGGPLLLAHFRVSRSVSSDDSRFVLYDAEGREVWSKVVEADICSDPARPDVNLVWRLTRRSRFVSSTRDGQFELWSHSQQTNLRFQVVSEEASPVRWRVRELGRVPGPAKLAMFPSSPEARFAREKEIRTAALHGVPTRRLRPLGSFSFLSSDPSDVVVAPGASEFEIDDQGRFGFARRRPNGGWMLEVLSPQGVRLRAIDLPFHKDGLGGTCWLGGDRWLVWGSGDSDSVDPIHAWWVDGATGKVQAGPDLGRGRVDHICRWINGGFALLIGRIHDFAPSSTLVTFDRSGREVWRHTGSADGKEESQSFLLTSGMAFTASDQIAVVGNDQVRLFSREGRPSGRWFLSGNLGRELNSLGAVCSGSDGTLLMEELGKVRTFLRFSSDGRLLNEFSPRRPDGTPVAPIYGFATAPRGGELWLNDSASLVAVDATGRVAQVLGPEPRLEQLTVPSFQSVDAYGRLHVFDGRTGAVHSFDGQGRRLRVLDHALLRDPQCYRRSVFASADGTTIVNLESAPPGFSGSVLFAPDATNGIPLHLDLDPVSQDLKPMRAPGRALVEGYEFAYLVGMDGRLIKRIERRHGGHWLCRVRDTKVLPDGRILIASQEGEDWDDRWYASLFSSEGEPLSSTELPIQPRLSTVDHARGSFVYSTESGFVWVNQKGQIVFRCVPRGSAGAALGWITNQERELWVLSGREGQMDRYALPR